MKSTLSLFLAALLLSTLSGANRRFVPPPSATGIPSPPYLADVTEWWDTRAGYFSTTGAGKLLNSWTGRINGKTLTGAGLTRPMINASGAVDVVGFYQDSTIAGTYTSGTFSDGEIVLQTTNGARGVAAGTQSSGASLRLKLGANPVQTSNTLTWVGQTSGAVFTPSAYPATVTTNNYLTIDPTLSWKAHDRSVFYVSSFSIGVSATQNTLFSDYLQNGTNLTHWYGSAVTSNFYTGSNRSAYFSSVTSGSTNFTLGMGAESYTSYASQTATNSGGELFGASSAAGSQVINGDVQALLIYNRGMTLAERQAVLDWLSTNYKSTARTNTKYLAMVGDSITAGVGGRPWPTQLADLCTYHPKFSNRGSSGASVYPSAGIVVASSLVDTDLSRNAWAGTRTLIFAAGTNDISVNARSAAQIQTDIANWITARRAATSGVIIVGCTILNKAGFSGANNTTKDTVNTWIKTTADFNYVVDVQADSRLQDTTNTTYFATDQIHPNAAGYAVMASLIYATLSANALVP